jgi:hypothetical protein
VLAGNRLFILSMKIEEERMVRDKDVRQYRELFCHRRDAYAVQTDEGAYYAVRQPVSDNVVKAHLLGRLTAGWYTLDEASTVRWAAFDADEEDGLIQLQEVGQALEKKDWPVYLEDSRRGGHLWVFFRPHKARKRQIGAASIRAVLEHLLVELGLDEAIEVFPKQDDVGQGGLGNLVRGPLGVHQVCSRRFSFLELASLEPVGSNLLEQLEYISQVEFVTAAQVAEELARILGQAVRRRVPTTRAAEPSLREEGVIEELKEEIGDVYTFVSRYVRLDEQGKGHCPFHPPDRHPSFAVNRGGNYWVDFHDQTGGDAIAFYQRLKGIGLLQAVEELAQLYGRTDLIAKMNRRKAMEKRQPEDVLSEAVFWLLKSAEEGRLLCPDCWTPVRSEFVDIPEFFVGLLLYCVECSFVEALSAPTESWGPNRCEEEESVPERVR